MSATAAPNLEAVLPASAVGRKVFEQLFAPYGLAIRWHSVGSAIPGTYWGEPEAGLIASTLHARDDTPVQSLLHEGCHWLCMLPKKRKALHTNVGGSMLEECAACYLQILLASRVEAIGEKRILADMDAWGYSFRAGSAAQWFQEDAEDARVWLIERGLLCATTGRVLGPSAQDHQV